MKKFDLEKYKKNAPFQQPRDYFEDLEKRIHGKIEVVEGKKTFTKETPFSVPHNYFESLLSKIQQKIGAKKTAPLLWLQNGWLQYGLVSACLILMVIFLNKWNNKNVLNEREHLAGNIQNIEIDVSKAEIIEYLSYRIPSHEIVESVNLSDKELVQIADLQPNTQLKESKIVTEEKLEEVDVLNHIDDQELEEILLDEIDLEDLEDIL